jgi:hypothetical protein
MTEKVVTVSPVPRTGALCYARSGGGSTGRVEGVGALR